MSKTLDDLREQLFKTIEGLQDTNNPMDIDRAKAVSEVAQVIINTAKVEVEHIRVVGTGKSSFIPDRSDEQKSITGTGVKSINGDTITHRLRG